MLAKMKKAYIIEDNMLTNEREVEVVSYLHLEKMRRMIYLGVKRVFDVLVVGLALIPCAPIFLIVALLIKIDSRGGVFYKHKRIGKNGKPIYLYKFRSMREGADRELAKLLEDPEIRKEWSENYKIHGDPRVTRVGKILRKTSIDELPQIFNILKGDMSLIGPRPLVEDELRKYGKNRDKFLSVTPGVTGWWACNGRSATSYEDRMALELYYVDHQGLWLDIQTIWKTTWAVLKGHGAE